MLKGFVRPERLAELINECDRVAIHGHRNFSRTNAYFTKDRPREHPARRSFRQHAAKRVFIAMPIRSRT